MVSGFPVGDYYPRFPSGLCYTFGGEENYLPGLPRDVHCDPRLLANYLLWSGKQPVKAKFHRTVCLPSIPQRGGVEGGGSPILFLLTTRPQIILRLVLGRILFACFFNLDSVVTLVCLCYSPLSLHTGSEFSLGHQPAFQSLLSQFRNFEGKC